jgi:hypothetical protein
MTAMSEPRSLAQIVGHHAILVVLVILALAAVLALADSMGVFDPPIDIVHDR